MDENEPFTVGGWITYDGKFHGIKPSWWRRLLAKIQLRLSGWKFRLVGYDEFRRIVDEQNREDRS